MPTAHTRAYRDGALLASDFPLGDASEYLGDPTVLVWIDLVSPEPQDLHYLAGELGLHELAVEDALSAHQRPKIDFYDDFVFLTCRSVHLDAERGLLVEAEVNLFVAPTWCISVRKDSPFDIEPAIARWERSPQLLRRGGTALLYVVIDMVVDEYFEVVDSFDNYYETISDGLFADEPLEPAQQRHWFKMRRALVRFHRLTVPMRESVSSLMRREHDAIHAGMTPYFQDVYDHVLRVTDSSDSLRELVSTIVETNLSLRDYRQNQVMKRVTSWAAIIAVPTLVTGYYGMNVKYPQLGTSGGAITATVLTVGLPVGLYSVFKRRDWL